MRLAQTYLARHPLCSLPLAHCDQEKKKGSETGVLAYCGDHGQMDPIRLND